VQRRLPSDLPSTLLFLAYAGTAVAALGAIAQAVGQPDAVPLSVLGAFYLVAGLAGLWFGRNLIVLIPAVLLWLLAAQASLFSSRPSFPWALVFGACAGVGVWVGIRSVIGRRADLLRSNQAADAATNHLGWNLFKLSSELPLTDENVSETVVHRDLRVGELQRHFDQLTSASIRGGMEHAFRLSGWTTELHGVPGGYFDTSSHTSLGGGGFSRVDLGLSGTTADELTGEAFIAVFEQPAGAGVDTIRAVVPSERQVRAYVAQLFALWSTRVGVNTKTELMIRRYAGAITNAVSSESSYVGDRLNATLRLPGPERPNVTIVGQTLDGHTLLIGAIRFGSGGPLYQLFPIALVHSLVDLMDGRPLPPQPPSPLPPPDPTNKVEVEADMAEPAASVTGSVNGHLPALQVRTLGGLRITAGGEDLTSALLDRKVLAFLWLHLLARTLRNPDGSITRSSLADELSPGLDTSAQRSRLRGRLSELRNQLPASLGRRVQVQGERIHLDLADCTIDARDLADAARMYEGSNGILTSDQLTQLDAIVAGVQGSFLTEWDEIEQHVNSGRSGAGEVVNDLRQHTDAALGTLLRTLGSTYLARGNPEAAIDPLERALALSPDDEAAARSLSAACVQTGRLSRAEQLRKDFSLV
jgi:hypothetical protein